VLFRSLFGFLGMLLGLVPGLRWGMPRGWLVALGTTAGGAVGGGIGGCLSGWLLEPSVEFTRRLSDKPSAKYGMLGEVFRWSSLVLLIAVILWLGYLLLRALPGSHR
jgi:hypothetical protein